MSCDCSNLCCLSWWFRWRNYCCLGSISDNYFCSRHFFEVGFHIKLMWNELGISAIITSLIKIQWFQNKLWKEEFRRHLMLPLKQTWLTTSEVCSLLVFIWFSFSVSVYFPKLCIITTNKLTEGLFWTDPFELSCSVSCGNMPLKENKSFVILAVQVIFLHKHLVIELVD